MGFENYSVYKPLRKALSTPGKKADIIYERVRTVLKTLSNTAAGAALDG